MQEPTLDQIIDARARCAKAIARYGEQYLPIFERLDNEIAKRVKQQSLLNKAIEIGTQNGTQNGTHLTDIFMKTI
ncbi:hypothetical protein KORDIASMS9_01824 [Kordia sp. SMS9]|uniref:hypothetical protein n=1 Tax=Kordia sp. SMS9 TaxID=2282170 RepID=UPI000E0D13F2|nr:hypothetical protein [Kordia sp. SMS9]AXG69599.1 hypothetical protein KORDIASMS9_01824 [Kordia sp. SMS9]